MNRKFLRLSLQITFVFTLLALYLSFQIYVLRINYQIQGLQQKLAQINRDNETLQLQLSQLGDTQYLEQYARSQLNMRTPDRVEYVEP